PVTYDSLNDLDGFAWEHGRANAGSRVSIDRLVGFCLLIRREVIDTVGMLDERFGIGCFEDDDYCRRALDAGFEAVIAADSFVHHFGSVTFRNSGVDFAKVLRDNEVLYRDKWQSSVEARSEVPSSLEFDLG